MRTLRERPVSARHGRPVKADPERPQHPPGQLCWVDGNEIAAGVATRTGGLVPAVAVETTARN